MDTMHSEKMTSPDRTLVLEPIDGKAPLNTIGMVDKRLFTGENELHAIMDLQTCLWKLKYNSGIVPEPLKQQFTGFRALHKFCEEYFRKRNIRIKEVINNASAA